MVSAKDCRLRILTSEGYEDSLFSVEKTEGGQPTAIVAIKEFISKIEALRKK